MIDLPKIKVFDGEEEIIFSETFNVYNDELIIKNFLGFSIKFIFEKDEPKKNQKDVVATPNNETKEIEIILSKKVRSPLGVGTIDRFSFLENVDGSKILASIYVKEINKNALNIIINLYLKK
jgi:hypothetical protein